MPRTPSGPSTRYALLALLSLGRGSGYDLKQRAEFSVGHFWAESFGQIYPALKQLQRDGLVTRDVQSSKNPGKPDRLVYAITAAGQAALEQWLALPPRPEPFRSELLFKLFFASQAPAGATTEHLARFRDVERGHLRRYHELEAELTRRYAEAPGLLYWLATVSYGVHRSTAIVRWVDETLRRLAKAPPLPRPARSPGRGKRRTS